MYTPRTGARCSCRPGIARDNCPNCEGTGWAVDFAAIRARKLAPISNAERLPFYFTCAECGARVKSRADHSADLTGAPFASYRCKRCTQDARARINTQSEV